MTSSSLPSCPPKQKTNRVLPSKKKKPIKKKSKKKDPNQPKRPLTAFLCFSVRYRALLKTKNPTWTFKQLAMEVGKQWKTINEDQNCEELKEYQRLVAKDHIRYKKEMASYVPPVESSSDESSSDGSDDSDDSDEDSGEDSDDDDDSEQEDAHPKKRKRGGRPRSSRGSSKKKKKKKDPNKPKKPMNSYLCFLKKNRPLIIAEHPDWTFGQIGKSCVNLLHSHP
jgi:hypothetical protein